MHYGHGVYIWVSHIFFLQKSNIQITSKQKALVAWLVHERTILNCEELKTIFIVLYFIKKIEVNFSLRERENENDQGKMKMILIELRYMEFAGKTLCHYIGW
ncbi:hypothetical protein ACJX0J_008055, partial [Zea mays]